MNLTYECDKGAEKRLYTLQKTFPNAIPLFGGAIFATTAAKAGDMADFVEYLPNVIQGISFWRWKEGVKAALNTFCHLCLVDPKLVEVYLGMTFKEIEKNV